MRRAAEREASGEVLLARSNKRENRVEATTVVLFNGSLSQLLRCCGSFCGGGGGCRAARASGTGSCGAGCFELCFGSCAGGGKCGVCHFPLVSLRAAWITSNAGLVLADVNPLYLGRISTSQLQPHAAWVAAAKPVLLLRLRLRPRRLCHVQLISRTAPPSRACNYRTDQE